MTAPTDAHNPDRYIEGTKVIPSMKAILQALGRRKGWITSRWPTDQIVTVKWVGKKNTERWHVDLLDIIP